MLNLQVLNLRVLNLQVLNLQVLNLCMPQLLLTQGEEVSQHLYTACNPLEKGFFKG